MQLKPKDGQTWGNWKYDADTLTLVNEEYSYEIDLESCATSSQTLDWIFQIAGKPWGTADELGQLVLALDDILDPQASLCSGGANKTLDVKKFLNRPV